MKKIGISLLTLLALSGTLMADGAAVYKKCAGCHGAKGEKHALGKSKIINTFTKSEIVAAIKGYQDGTYGGAMKGVMKGQVKNMSEADIKAVADLIGK
ncbi:c-type cytochrome [Sulfurimonas sp. HSL-1716]|uniref:c-type cytochrome n=1 Tax=Hydrocurvibacter sulfurireducens TaxID=3131937 RepID=UPI0031F9A423